MCCTYCGGEHKQTGCEATVPKCINYGGAHRTLAAACKIRKELIKKRSEEIRERSKSRNRQGGDQGYVGTQSYAKAMRAGTAGGGREQETTTPLTKEETKDMLTIIMSAIVYGHYMEALVPGSFQDNMNEVYRLNGIRTVKFPPPTMAATVMEACKEVFRGRSKEEKRREKEEDSSEPNLVMDLNDEAIEQEAIEIETVVKRHRESTTPPLREDKRKKQEREIETEMKKRLPLPQRQPNKQISEPQTEAIAKTREGIREKAREAEEHGHREAAIQPRSRASSTSSQQSTQSTQSQQGRSITKQVGITVYARKSSK